MIGGLENGIPSVFRAALETSHPGGRSPRSWSTMDKRGISDVSLLQ